MCQRISGTLPTSAEEEIEEPCDHEGHVTNGECERCGERGLESDAEIYEKEAPR